jgi:hypothetical protein
MTGEQPTYRDLWGRIRDHLPKKGRGTDAVARAPAAAAIGTCPAWPPVRPRKNALDSHNESDQNCS